ncbi:MAG: sigma-70 family RNA polymerase sigma factor [Actinomycetota bacterium]
MQTDLATSFRAGDPDAVRQIYRRYAGPVTTVAMSVLHDRELAADAVQQTFVKAWKAASTFDADRELAPWLYSIARRTAIDVLRAEKTPTRGDHAPEQDQPVESIGFERTWEAFEVRRAVEDLPDGEREVVQLSHGAGMTHAEIAERLGIPPGTVKSRSNRAHRRLAAALGHLGPDAA